MKIGIHELGAATNQNSHEQTLENVAELAQLAEKWGYHRFWMAEHHGSTQYTSSAPEVISAYLAAKTNKIRVGTGGIMMMHYSPLKVAEVVNTINTLAPGRMDFGVGRAPGSDMDTAQVLGKGEIVDPNKLYQDISTTMDYIKGHQPDHSLYKQSRATPMPNQLPEAYLLGSSGNSAVEAGRKGYGYAFAQFFLNGAMQKNIFDAYKSSFQSSAFHEKPNIIVSYNVTVGETEKEAEYQAKPADLMKLFLEIGKKPEIMSPEQADQVPLSQEMKRIIEVNRQTHIVGTPEQVAKRLLADKEKFGFDEILLANFSYSHQQRKYTYESLAKELLKQK